MADTKISAMAAAMSLSGLVLAGVQGGANVKAPNSLFAASRPQGRITLTPATPILTADVAGATTIYYTPYEGQFVPLYDGTDIVMTDIGGELSQATTDASKSPAAVANNSNYDIFIWNDAGTIRCTRGPAWTSDTARGTGAGTTEIERVEGFPLNKVAITNGPAAQRGTYVGTVRSNGSAAIEFRLGGTSAGGTEAKISVWNAYNRVPIEPLSQNSTSSWTYNSTAWRNAQGSATNRISFIRGINEDAVQAIYAAPMTGGASGDAQIGVALDGTTPTGIIPYFSIGTNTGTSTAVYSGLPGIGSHYLQAVERQVTTTSSATFFGVIGGIQLQGLTAGLLW